jgi:hypothetical protein
VPDTRSDRTGLCVTISGLLFLGLTREQVSSMGPLIGIKRPRSSRKGFMEARVPARSRRCPARYTCCCFGPSSAIAVWLLLDFGRQFNKAPDCFSTGWEVGLAAAPVVYGPQKLLRYPHLKEAILRAFRWAATRPVVADHFL